MSEQTKSPCDGMDKWQFDVVVNKPDPEAPDVASQKNSQVVASHEGTEAGYLDYGFLGEELWITRMETAEPFRCRGCATQMRDALKAAYPDQTVRDGGNSNSKVGDLVVNKWVDAGEVEAARS